jgi:hypothetical protein
MTTPVRIPIWVRAAGWLTTIVAAGVTAELVWEQTKLTWRAGPQMVGFGLMHNYPQYFVAMPGLFLWVLILIGVVAFALIRRRTMTTSLWIDLAAAGLVVAVGMIPYQTWQLWFADRIAAAPQTGYFITAAGCSGNRRLIEALVAHGVRIDARDYAGNTALHTAAACNRVELIDYLLQQGVPIDAVDRYGDSALERAYERPGNKAAKVLEARGARRIRGTPEQRDKAIQEMVREDIDRRDRSR